MNFRWNTCKFKLTPIIMIELWCLSGAMEYPVFALGRSGKTVGLERAASPSKETQLSEIVHFENLSDQYVLGFGLDPSTGDQVPFAIYDKTLSTAYDGHFWKFLFLGSVGISNINLANLAQTVDPPIPSNMAEIPPQQSQQLEMTLPAMVVDLRRCGSSLRKAMIWATITNLVKGGLNAIPFYGPPQAAAALMERVFDFIELLYLHHHAQALHLFSEAIAGNKNSPFYTTQLSTQNLQDGVYYLLRSQTILSSILMNAFKDKDMTVGKYYEKINHSKASSLEALQSRNIEVYPIANTYFALGAQRDPVTRTLKKLKIYSLGFTKLGRSNRPHSVVDFLNPNREVIKREILQAILMASNFIYIPVPGVVSVLKLIYKEGVVREYHRRQMWENGYLAHMRHLPDELAELLEREIGLTREEATKFEKMAISKIEERRLNPLDLPTEEIELLKVRVENWIRAHDPLYL